MSLRLSLAACVLLALAPLAFWPAYLSRVRVADAYTHTHALLGTAWLLLLILQPLLVRRTQIAMHRRVGRVGVLVGLAFFVSGVLLAHHRVARMDLAQFAREGRYVYLPLGMAVIFGAALLLAVRWRRHAPAHGRFMAATTLPLLDPLFSRLLFSYAPPLPAPTLYQLPAFSLAMIVVVAMATTMPATSPARGAMRAFAAGVVVLLLAFFVVADTAAWQAFATWFRGLPIT